jgi:hypothetical protein
MERGMGTLILRMALAAVAALGTVMASGVAAEEPAKPAYDVVLLSLTTDWQALRYHVETGEAWYALRGDWKPVSEADSKKPPAGDYKVCLSKTGENDWIAVRLERKSGRSWRLAALKWAEMKVVEADKEEAE